MGGVLFALEEIASSEQCNVGGLQIDDDTKEVQVVAFNYARLERRFFDKELESDFTKLQAAAPEGCEVSVASRTRDKSVWVVSFRRDDGPTDFVLYERPSGALTPYAT